MVADAESLAGQNILGPPSSRIHRVQVSVSWRVCSLNIKSMTFHKQPRDSINKNKLVKAGADPAVVSAYICSMRTFSHDGF